MQIDDTKTKRNLTRKKKENYFSKLKIVKQLILGEARWLRQIMIKSKTALYNPLIINSSSTDLCNISRIVDSYIEYTEISPKK